MKNLKLMAIAILVWGSQAINANNLVVRNNGEGQFDLKISFTNGETENTNNMLHKKTIHLRDREIKSIKVIYGVSATMQEFNPTFINDINSRIRAKPTTDFTLTIEIEGNTVDFIFAPTHLNSDPTAVVGQL